MVSLYNCHRANLTVSLVEFGESIASEGKGEYLYLEGRVLTTDSAPIAGATIETWETDQHGMLLSPDHYLRSCY